MSLFRLTLDKVPGPEETALAGYGLTAYRSALADRVFVPLGLQKSSLVTLS